jgi:folate-dependent tRNA-U54 methylase TrmFO/GidA
MCAELWELTEKAALRSADMHGTGPVMLRQTGCQRHRLASESDLLQTGLRVKHKTKLRFAGNVERAEMFRTFNMGIGMVMVVAEGDVAQVQQLLPHACVIGHVVQQPGMHLL